MQFDMPEPGRTVTVTTRFRDIYYYATQEWEDKTYTGVVGRVDRTVPAGSFVLLTDNDFMPRRLIALRNVHELKYSDGSAVSQSTSPLVRTWQVTGSRGAVYTVTQRDSVKSCTCPGFTFRKTCKHVESAA
jgi:hypothetical protein